MKTLKLTLKKKWFDMILSGEKTEEYREIKPYWLWRLFWNNGELENHFEVISDMKQPYKRFADAEELLNYFGLERKEYEVIELRNGYNKNAPRITIQLKGIYISKGKEKWGAENDKYYFVLKLGRILSKSNCG